MIRLARLSLRRPVAALLAFGVLSLALSLIGLGVSHSLSPSITVVPGTEASRAQHLADAHFGPSVLVPILLEGPAKQLDRQGPAVVRALARRPDTRVLSAWDSGATGAQLRPRKTAAMIVASVARSEKDMVATEQPAIEKLVQRTTSGSVHASITGQPSIDRAMRTASIHTTRQRMAYTLPLLFLVLLLLLRAPIAAGLVTAVAAGTAYSGLGITALLGKITEVDAIDVVLGMMTGLALGVGYALLFYRRWRSELTKDVAHHDAAHAASAAVETSGRALLIGGTAVVTSLLVADLIGPSKVLGSLAVTAVLCALLAVGMAVVVMPAALILLGDRAQAFSFGMPAFIQRPWMALTGQDRSVVTHAVPMGALATALLVVLALPLLSIDTGPPSAKFLGKGDGARKSYERVAKVMGPGWPTPYNVVVVSKTRPLTDAALLRQLDGFQKSLATDPRIASVVGPGEFAATRKELQSLPAGLKDSTKLLKGGKKDLGRLQNGLGQAGAGAVQLRSGLADAAAGAGQLKGGSGTAQAGAGALHNGLAQARSGAAQISTGLGQALDAARKLRDGAGQALQGSKKLTGGLGQAVTPVKTGAPIVKQMAADVTAGSDAVKGAQGSAQALSAQLDEAASALAALPESESKTAAVGAVTSARNASGGLESSLGTTGTRLAGAASIAGAFSTQVAQLFTGLAQLYAGSSELQTGIGQLHSGNAALAAGIDKLSGGGGQLTTGVTALRDGAAQLEAGLGQLTGGAGQLAGGLAAGSSPTGQLISGLGQLESGVAKFRTNLPSPKDIEKLQKQSPGLFDSGYFVLAAIAGAPAAQRTQASFAVNLDRGGNAGQITVISKYASEDPRSQRLGQDLQKRVDGFARAGNTEAAVGGPAGSLGDFRSETASRIWPVVIGVSVVVLLLLMMLLRTVILPIVAVAFDLLTAAATFGVVTALFGGDNPVLGGLGYIDPMTIIATFAAIFGMTILYEVQLLARTREEFVLSGDASAALQQGLSKTAAAGTGAAVAMIAVLIPFTTSDLIMVRQLGVAVAVAIVLDAFIVRPVLLPAAVQLLGHASWWPTSRSVPRITPERVAPRHAGAPLGPAAGSGA